MAWIDKLVDIVMQGLPGTALALIPDHMKKQWLARVRDHDPFRQISLNHDLTRATRLAWIEAALILIESVPPRTAVSRTFKSVVMGDLRQERHDTLDGGTIPDPSPIDAAVLLLVHGVGGHIASGSAGQSSNQITASIAHVLADLTGWHIAEIPPEFVDAAAEGVVQGGAHRTFGDLAFDAFAATLKDPNQYPEAQASFHIAMQQVEQDLSRSILSQVAGLNQKMDDAIAKIDQATALHAGLSETAIALSNVATDVGVTRSLAEQLVASAEAQKQMLMDHHRHFVEAIAALGRAGPPVAESNAETAPDLAYVEKYYFEIGRMLYAMMELQAEREMASWVEMAASIDTEAWAKEQGFKDEKSYAMHLALGTLHERISDSAFAVGNRTFFNDVIEPHFRGTVKSLDRRAARRKLRSEQLN